MSTESRIVIIADADRNLRNVLRQHFTELGSYPILAADGAEAESVAMNMQARMVILDIDLTIFTSYDACARIRRTAGYQSVPIVLMSAIDAPRRRAAAQRAGANSFLVKPFSVNDLMREVAPFFAVSGPPVAEKPAAPSRPRVPGFGGAPVQVWEPSPQLTWKFGTDSKLAEGKRWLELVRAPSRRPVKADN